MINTAGKITYRLTAGAENDTICWTVTISNPNYEKFTKDLVLTLTAKEPQETLRITGDNTVAYGQKLVAPVMFTNPLPSFLSICH